MRKLVFAINLTADGCCDHTKGDPNDEVHDYFTRLNQEAGVLLYGRKTYELMVPFWPDIAKNNSAPSKTINDFAKSFVAVDKMVVVSRSLTEVEGENTSISHSDLKNEIIKLKQQPGKNILTGGVDIPSQLIALGLVDEYHFVTHPIIAGEGKRLFDELKLPEGIKLKLTNSKTFPSGHVAHHYVNE